MKKILCVGILLLVFIYTTRADDLADLLQDLAIQTACIGMYSTAETGVMVTSRYDDPPNWYDVSMMANRFANMSGNMTRITTFYGVCFDYAQFAWDDIYKYQKLYNEAGMKSQQWYIAVANDGDPYTIILYDPVSRENATTVSNGVYLKEIARHKVYTHDGATGHAWLWVQHKNGTWYWIDPTWTDNTGYVWWGKVEYGREVAYYPDPVYCVASNYPRPGITGSGTRSSDSTYTESPGSGVNLAHLGYSFGYVRSFDFDSAKYGFTISIEDQFPNILSLFSFSLDYLHGGTEGENDIDLVFMNTIIGKNSFVFGAALGCPVFRIFTIYAGGGLGFTWNGIDSWADSSSSDGLIEFAWKINGGLRIQSSSLFAKFDVSYGTIIGPSFGIGIGIFM